MQPDNLPIIGFLTEGHESDFDYEIYRQLSAAATNAGAHLVVVSGIGIGHKEADDPFRQVRDDVARAVTSSGLFTGLIMANSGFGPETRTERLAFFEHHRHMPVVTIGFQADTVPCVEVENSSGMDSLVTHLIEQHQVRRFVFIRDHIDETGDFLARYESYYRVLKRNGIPLEKQQTVCRNIAGWAESLARNISMTPPADRPQAIMCCADGPALQMLESLSAFGTRIPQDILVAGFDDLEGKNSIPRLTGCRQPWREICTKAVEMVLRIARGKEVPMTVRMPATLVVHDSCGCPWNKQHSETIGDTESRELPLIDREPYHTLRRELLRCFKIALKKNEPGVFIRGLDAGIRIGLRESIEPVLWHVLLRCLPADYAADAGPEPMDRAGQQMLQDGHIFVGDLMRRFEGKSKAMMQRTSGDTLNFASAMAAATTSYELAEIIGANRLAWSELNIRGIIAFDQIPGTTDRGRLLFADNKACHAENNETFRQLAVSEFLGEILAVREKPIVLNAALLRDAWEPVGFTVCEGEPADRLLFMRMRILLGNAIKSVSLIEQVRKQANELSIANDQLILLRAKEQEYLDRVRQDLELARRIQADFLPREIPKLDGWNMAVFFQPAQEVSGDFYDLFTLPGDKVAIVVADVCGKSVSAAIFMALVRSLTRARSEGAHAPDPVEVVSYINEYIIRNHKQSNMFVTLFYGILDQAVGTLSYVNAGHPPPIVTGRTSVRGPLKNCGPAVGIVPGAKFTLREETLALGDMLFAYTDGVTEAQDVHGVLLGKEKLFTVLENSLVTPQSLVDSVRRTIAEHNKGRSASDDITMVAVKRI